MADGVDLYPQIQEALYNLGEDEEEVGRALIDLGVRGYPMDADLCPLAGYLRQVVDHRVHIKITGSAAYWRLESGLRVGLPLSKHVRNFVLEFDAGDWPDLLPDSGEWA